MAEAVVDIILGNLRELMVYKASLLNGVMKEHEALMSDLQVLKGAIKDLSANNDQSFEHTALLNNIRKAVDKAEDAVDEFIIQETKYRNKPFFVKIMRSLDHSASFHRCKAEIGHIREITDKMVTGQRKAEELTLPTRSKAIGSGLTKAPVVEEDNVVGFGEPAKELISYLLEDSARLDVIAIVGMGGLGKTTLAHMVYTDDKIVCRFKHRAWGYASMGCRVEDVLTSILRQLGHASEDAYKMSRQELADEVKRCLKDANYFIVLDDLWLFETWYELRSAFPDNNNHSRILLTTRMYQVAQHANLNRAPFDLKLLDKKESFELLERKVFGNSKCPIDLVEFGLKIAEACRGLPLAIVIISGILLAKRQMKDWWEKVAERVNQFLNNGWGGPSDVIVLAYDTLPSNVKLCLLYFGLLPEGAVNVSNLIRLWIAEGFIRDELNLGLENMARTCLDNLVDRSLVIPISRRSNGEIRTCQVHDILHDFCKREAEVQGFYHDINESHVSWSGNCRRINVPSNILSELSQHSPGAKIRTILTFSDDTVNMAPEEMKRLEAYKMIRILEATSIKFSRFPKNLVLLRYLAFSCDFNSIPSSISNLWSLQTLIIITSARVIEFPEEIWKLYQLRHLETNASTLLPVPPESISRIGQKNMQTLSTIAPESCTKEVFSRVPDVKKLGIQGELRLILSTTSMLIETLERLNQLINLKLINDLTSGSIVQNLSAKFSKVVARLTKLTISGTSLGWESMTILGELKMLEVLKVKNNAFIGEQWNGAQGTFPSLILLSIDTTDLKTWVTSENQFLKLTSLLLKNCDKLEAIPTLLADLPSFQNLDVYNCCTSVAQSARKIHSKGAISRLTIYPPNV